MKETKRSLVASIYIYFFTAVGLIMFLVGSFQLVQFGVKKFVLQKYYLQEWQESRCDNFVVPAVAPIDKNSVMPVADQKQQQEAEQKCKVKLEEQRKIQQVIDLSTALTLIFLGAATFIFHYRKTQEK